jgi:ParB-like chromosome segregation protein Spo0J
VTVARPDTVFDPVGTVDETASVPIDDLSPGPPVRAIGVNEEHVNVLMEIAGQWPPVLATRGGRVVDGTHRLIAARRAGLSTLSVCWFDGTDDEAFVEAVRRNVTHGLPLSFDDRVEAVRRLLQSHGDWSDRRIARICAVAPRTVAHARLRGPKVRGQVLEKRLGMDGRRRPAKGASDRTRILDVIENNPDRSLRSIALEVGVSPETVRSVRASFGTLPRPSPPRGDRQGRETKQGAHESEHGATLSRWPDFVEDPAFGSRPDQHRFAVWFDAMAVSTEDSEFARLVPLGRVYEVADEARRRAAFWASFASELELHARPRLGGDAS